MSSASEAMRGERSAEKTCFVSITLLGIYLKICQGKCLDPGERRSVGRSRHALTTRPPPARCTIAQLDRANDKQYHNAPSRTRSGVNEWRMRT